MSEEKARTNLRDWQKKNVFFDYRYAEVDLLIQIIEKQSEALEFYSKRTNWGHATQDGVSFSYIKNDLEPAVPERNLPVGKGQVVRAFEGGKRARTVQAEVQQIVERLIDDRR